MKKTLKVFLFFCCFFFLFLPVGATSEQESLENFANLDLLFENLPEDLNALEIKEILENKTGDTKGFFQNLLKSAFSLGITESGQMLFSLIALILISALFQTIKKSFVQKELGDAFDFLFVLVSAIICYKALENSILLTLNTLDSIQSFFLTSLPVITILLTLSGSPSSAATLSANLSLVLGLASSLTTSLLAPLLQGLFALSLSDGIARSNISSILNFFRRWIKTLSILFFTLISAVLSLNNALAVAQDSLSMRSVRFAAGNFIPIVGSLVGESAKTLSSAFKLIRTKCGILCILVLLYIILRPIIAITIKKIILNIASSISDILSEPYLGHFIKSISSLMDLLLALMISEGCYLIFYITLFLTNKGSL